MLNLFNQEFAEIWSVCLLGPRGFENQNEIRKREGGSKKCLRI